jgi:phospholipid/cholesterol/gamma-HCH transport system substrate-binding protein
MIFGRSRLELKVGIFVFIGLIILSVFVVRIGNLNTGVSGYQANFIFNFVNGVRTGAPVRFGGVDIGEVKSLKFILSPLEQKTQVQIVSWLKTDVRIPSDSAVWINTLGLLGEKYVEIMPGKDYANCLSENGTLIGTDPIPMQEVTELAKGIATRLQGTLSNLDESIVKLKNKEGTVGKLLYDDAIYKELEAFVQDLKAHPWKLFFKPKEKAEKK